MADFEGAILSDYLLVQCINKGGIADVYRARQNGEGQHEVAVKIFRPGYAGHETFREYFMDEAEKIGQFDHPNILPLLEFGEGDGLLYVVTPFVVPGTLEDLLNRVGGRFSAMQAVPIVRQLCSAVQYTHDHGVIHGNIKPSNIFVATDGRMLLSDFGIAHGYDDSQQSLTRIGWGSAEYASPEQSLGVWRNGSDIYSLGVLLFRILTGQPPFSGQTPVEILLKHVRQQPPSARSIVPTISDAVDAVLQRAIQKRSDNRFTSAQEFADAFITAVTLAPVASPVAKQVNTEEPQLTLDQPPSFIEPATPTPVSSASSSASSFLLSPETPVPAHLAFSSPISRRPYELPPVSAAPPSQPLQSENTTQGRSFLQENEKAGPEPFLPVPSGPPEWSPIDNNPQGPIPLHASDYLAEQEESKWIWTPPEPADPIEPVKNVESPTNIAEPSRESQLPEPASDEAKKPRSLFNKLLPIIVVLLLLIGLAGALLSSFFYSGNGSSTNYTPSYKEHRGYSQLYRYSNHVVWNTQSSLFDERD